MFGQAVESSGARGRSAPAATGFPATAADRPAWSRHAYAEVVTDQKVATWLGCHRRAFEWFNGVPRRLTIDNPKCAITRACYHDPQVQRAYAECAEGYGFKIEPCPVRDPKKKSHASYCAPFATCGVDSP